MSTKLKSFFTLRFILIAFSILIANSVNAHSPDLSNMMLYEQNGKNMVTIRSSLTAFEGEIDYIFDKKAYKTPEEFKDLCIRLVLKRCVLVINQDTIKLINPQINLGHETIFFAELQGVPSRLNSLYVSNKIFGDMPHNQCELIIALKNMESFQYIFNNENDHEVELKQDNHHWKVIENTQAFFRPYNPILWFVLLIFILLIFYIYKRLF